jgi:hypothetical protein
MDEAHSRFQHRWIPYATFRSLYRQSRASQVQEINQRNMLTPPDWVQRPAAH